MPLVYTGFPRLRTLRQAAIWPAAGCAIVGLFFAMALVATAAHLWTDYRVQHGVATEAVVDRVEVAGRLLLHVHYRTRSEALVHTTIVEPGTTLRHGPGDELRIRYQATRPDSAEIAGKPTGSWTLFVGLLVCTTVFLAATAYFWRDYRQDRADDEYLVAHVDPHAND